MSDGPGLFTIALGGDCRLGVVTVTLLVGGGFFTASEADRCTDCFLTSGDGTLKVTTDETGGFVGAGGGGGGTG